MRNSDILAVSLPQRLPDKRCGVPPSIEHWNYYEQRDQYQDYDHYHYEYLASSRRRPHPSLFHEKSYAGAQKKTFLMENSIDSDEKKPSLQNALVEKYIQRPSLAVFRPSVRLSK